SSGASQTCTSYSYPTASNTLTHRATYSAHINTHSVTSSHSHHSQQQPPQQPSIQLSQTHHPHCPIHSLNAHNQHFFFSPSTSHQSSSSAPVATTSTLASTHSQSHQYLVHCVAPSQSLIHSPMPTLQEADYHKQNQQTKSQPSTQSHHYPHASSHSYHSHFQKHPSAPNLLPPPPPAPAPSPSPSASAIPMNCTCDVGCTQASTSASAPAPQGRL
ncbi:uncharacterized protein ACRADG_012787, partial [Cochliomyia hominivorax]